MKQLMPACAPFTAPGGQAIWQGSTRSSVSSGWEGFALQIISSGMTQPQGRHVLKWRGIIPKFPSFPGWKLQAARVDVRGSRTGEIKCPGYKKGGLGTEKSERPILVAGPHSPQNWDAMRGTKQGALPQCTLHVGADGKAGAAHGAGNQALNKGVKLRKSTCVIHGPSQPHT